MASDELARIKELPILRTMFLISEGKTVTEACGTTGVSERTFRRALIEHPEYTDQVVLVEQTGLQERAAKARDARWHNIDQIIEKANDGELELHERILLNKELANIQAYIGTQLDSTSPEIPELEKPNSTAAAIEAFLHKNVSVKLKPGVGKITQTVEFQIENKKNEDVIEGEVEDSEASGD